MERLNQEIDGFLKASLEDVRLSARQKQNLQRAMAKELKNRQDNWWRRAIYRITRFMDTTFEISVAPVAAAVGLSVILVGAGIFIADPGAGSVQAPGPVMYMQHSVAGPDGSIQIMYTPLPKGGI